ncbi:hypothetical protein EAI_12106, partial [Harpegnathos saltator]
ANHKGNAGKMEMDAIATMFNRSLYDVKYINFIDDGVSKTYKMIKELHSYKDIVAQRKECIDHVQ